MKRASIEPNFHKTYSHFLEVLNVDTLYAHTIGETYKNIRLENGKQKCCDTIFFVCAKRPLHIFLYQYLRYNCKLAERLIGALIFFVLNKVNIF